MVKVTVMVLLAGLGLLFLAVDAMITGGVITGSAPAWLLPAGLASWCASWLVASLPTP